MESKHIKHQLNHYKNQHTHCQNKIKELEGNILTEPDHYMIQLLDREYEYITERIYELSDYLAMLKNIN